MGPSPFPGPLSVPPSPVSPSLRLATLGLPRAFTGVEIMVIRSEFSQTSTLGHLIVDNELWGYTMEDRLRPFGQKVIGLTCIPAGRYEVKLMWSGHFRKTLPRLIDVPFFDGVLFHGGNRPTDSEGCILIGREKKAFDWIFSSLSSQLVQAIEKKGGNAFVTIWNGPGSDVYLNGNGQI